MEDGKFIPGRREWRCKVLGHSWKGDERLKGPMDDDECSRCGARWETFHGDCPRGDCKICTARWEARKAASADR